MHLPGWKLDLDPSALPWRSTSAPGVQWLSVAQGPEPPAGRPASARDSTVLIRMQPGAGYPAHRHLDVEEVLVLQGGYSDERGTHRAGDYVRYEALSVHAPRACGDPDRAVGNDNPACLLFAIARGGIEPVDTP